MHHDHLGSVLCRVCGKLSSRMITSFILSAVSSAHTAAIKSCPTVRCFLQLRRGTPYTIRQSPSEILIQRCRGSQAMNWEDFRQKSRHLSITTVRFSLPTSDDITSSLRMAVPIFRRPISSRYLPVSGIWSNKNQTFCNGTLAGNRH